MTTRRFVCDERDEDVPLAESPDHPIRAVEAPVESVAQLVGCEFEVDGLRFAFERVLVPPENVGLAVAVLRTSTRATTVATRHSDRPSR